MHNKHFLRGKTAKFVLLAVLAAGLGYGLRSFFSAAPEDGAGGGGGFGVAVEAVTVKPDTLTVRLGAVGTLVAHEGIVLRPEVAGRMTGLLFTEGQKVEAGQPLVQLDPAISAAEVAQAEAQLALARRNAGRASTLVGRGAGTAQAVDETASQLRVAEAALQVARTNFEKTRIAAPFAGTVGIRQVSLGDYVQPGQALVSLQDLTSMKLDFHLPETALAAVKAGQKVDVQVTPYPGETFSGTVTGIDPLIDTATRSLAVRAEIPNESGKLRPGLFASVNLITGTRANVLFVPAAALVPMGDKVFVFRIAEGQATLTPVATGLRESDRVEIVSGLVAGDQVVSAGTGKLMMQGGAMQPMPVRVIDSSSSAAGGTEE